MSNLNVSLAVARERVVALEKEVADQARRKVEAEHAQMVAQCRDSRDNVQRLRAEANKLRDRSNRLDSRAENARRLLNEWRESKPQPASYPSPESYDEWRVELAARQTTASEAQRAYADATQEYQLARAVWGKAKEAFERLADHENELRSLLLPKRSGITIEVQDGAEGVRLYRA